MKTIRSILIGSLRKARNSIKRVQCYLLGLRARSSTDIAWSVSVDAGGGKVVVGNNTTLDIGVVLRAYGGLIQIGDNCSLNPYCVVQGGGDVRIGSGVRIAMHCRIIASNHIFADPNTYIYQQSIKVVGVTIEDDVWLGAGVTILDGTVIGKGSVIAAGAVITKSVEPYAIMAGIPAKRIGTRR